MRKRVSVLLVIDTALAALAAGCTSLDPQSDYAQASADIERATGQTSILPQEDARAVSQHVSSLLEDGLTTSEAVEICLLNNPGLQAAWMAVGMSRADLVQSGLLSNPRLVLSLRLPSGGGLANVETTLAQNLADLWQIPARKRGAQRDLDRAILELARQASQLAADTEADYYRAAGAARVHEIARENLGIARQLLDTATTRRQAGAGNELDVNLARSAALEAELSLEARRLEHAEAKRDLARRLGLVTEADDLVLTGDLSFDGVDQLETKKLVELAREYRLDVQAARQRVASAEAMVEEQRARVLPVFDAGVALERGERKRGVPKEGTDFIIGPMIGAEVPIFDQNQARIARAEYALRQAVRLLDGVDRRLVQDVRSAADQARTASQLAHLAGQQSVPLAQSSLDLSRQAYRAGKTSVLSVLEAQRFLLDARRRYVVALTDAATARAEVERVVGLPMDRIQSSLADAETGNSVGATESTNGDQP